MSDRPAEASKNVFAIRLPRLGQEIKEGMLVAWRVKEGDRIAKGQVLCEVETAKAVSELEAERPGRIARILAQEGDTVAVDGPLALLAESDADADEWLAARKAGEEPAPSGEAPPSRTGETQPAIPDDRLVSSPPSTRPRVSPAARRMAWQAGVDVGAIGRGSGPRGRVLSTDVAAAAAVRASEGESRRPLTPMRRAIARNLTRSKQTIPHFSARQTVDAAPALAFCAERKALHACSLSHVVLAACAKALREFPEFRSRIEGEEIVESSEVNIGVAVSLEDGLLVPVLPRADTLVFKDLCLAAQRLVESARQGRLEGAGKGVFTVTNMGMFGLEEFAAIIPPGESAVLAVGAAREAPIAEHGSARAGKVMTLTLSCDHRIIDGVHAAKFLARLREILRNPGEWM
ncbi:MAG: dihydrolipoamide acetyltransferase family protein [Candidatus Sumerlaeota bacterium]|nr:dihydrolipoamide acetyltransferase family protein [Candidatus Sumerlaeota bacterium]